MLFHAEQIAERVIEVKRLQLNLRRERRDRYAGASVPDGRSRVYAAVVEDKVPVILHVQGKATAGRDKTRTRGNILVESDVVADVGTGNAAEIGDAIGGLGRARRPATERYKIGAFILERSRRVCVLRSRNTSTILIVLMPYQFQNGTSQDIKVVS